ncbi:MULTISPECIES: DOMON-like domain-containing protein [Nostoc]|uniref:DOMON-like domain-containing protein n=1 Tax=Nostoc paludosum FACHB-159 TaxID=2692908 RepID=A0ABR8KDR3_9NOSO|nr:MULTISPECIES: DOMON-like domain-containing protein [Nostoc]MBD2681212.1 DOMON-like domain-containing protein [Nostoc sp. FACHB-857]MBD2737690.1 DOMON-like domain-containing protein [Nostoc paludosum FACHB-159]
MNSQTFSLQPFPSTESLANLEITGDISRDINQLSIGYNLTADLKEIVVAPPSNTPSRKHQLWEDTCFEFFLGIKNSQQYWEFNLSPAGHWNVYRFDAYRQGMREETALTILPFDVKNHTDKLVLTLNIDLDKIISPEQIIEVAITTVIKCKDNGVTYWALTHRGTKPDFHLRDSFILEL